MAKMRSVRELVERLFGGDARKVPSDDFDVWGYDGPVPYYLASIPDDLGDDAGAYAEAASVAVEELGATAGSLPGFVHFYDGHVEEAEVLEAEGGFVVCGTVLSVEGDELMAFDAAITAGPEGSIIVVAFSHVPRRNDDPRLDLEALGFGERRHLRYVSFTIGSG